MRVPECVWSINGGRVAVACAAMMLPTARTPAQRSAAAPAPPSAPARAPAQPGGAPPNSTAGATAADHRNMMEQLGITALRPGPGGNESAANHANYDEVLANPYPSLPQVLTLKTGGKVTSAAISSAWSTGASGANLTTGAHCGSAAR